MGNSRNPADSFHHDGKAGQSVSDEGKSAGSERIPFGTDCFDAQSRDAFGHYLRIFMSAKDGSPIQPESALPCKSMPDDASAIALRLKQLGQDIASGTADQLELLVRFDELKGWESSGSRHCVAWMNLEMGISLSLGWEYLRVGRRLRDLPITRALFRAGKLTWSIVRLLSRVADDNNEALLCHSALDASVSDVERICKEYHWQRETEDSADENTRSLRQIDARSFTWKSESNGNTSIKLSLPPEVALAFLNSVEQSLAQLEDTEATMPQRRADAAVLMAESALQNAGRDMATADRYQVIVSVDASESCNGTHSEPIPASRPTVRGAGPIAFETARRIACDCSVSTITHCDGEPVDIGRKSRLWPPAMARAIKNRDQHCQFPGCTQSRHLHIHHIQHWADGGHTAVDNGCCLCAHHHTAVHEGGYRIERINDQQHAAEEQFHQQTATNRIDNEFEKRLRNSRESFELVRKLSPSRFRFRIVNRAGRDIRDIQSDTSVQFEQTVSANTNTNTSDSTRVERPFHDQNRNGWQDFNRRDWPGVAEQAGHYGCEEGRIQHPA